MNPKSNDPLRIAVLTHNSRSPGGISVGQNLLSALGRVGPQNRYLVTISPGLGFEDACSSMPSCEILPRRHSGGLFASWFYERFPLPKQVNAFEPDMVLSLGNRGLFNLACPQAVMLRCSLYFYPSKHHGKLNLREKLVILYHRHHLRRILPQTNLVLCQTEVTKKRIRESYGYTGSMMVTPNFTSVFIDTSEEASRVPDKLRALEGKMKLLCLSAYYPHKNLEVLVQLFSRFRSELEGVAVILTIAADQHPNASKLLKSIEALSLSEQIVNLGPVPQRELGRYYRNCHALLLPTLLESFSATYVEAMSFGVPILTSDLDFARAVCKDAALYFDPWSPESIKDAILTLKDDPGLARALATRGESALERDAMSWDQTATALLDRVAAIVDSRQREARI